MSTSEQLSFAMVGELDARDRRLVLAWRDLGNDWMTSLLNSGVLRSHGPRVHPTEAAVTEMRQQTEQLLAERAERLAPSDEHRVRRKTAEHEAAHAIVALALGVEVSSVAVMPDGSGACWYEKGRTPQEAGAIALAGELWISDFRSFEYPEGDSGCGADRRAVAQHLDDFGARQAMRRAREILASNRSDVLALAARLERDSLVSFDGPV
jgi:hypothetical protein